MLFALALYFSAPADSESRLMGKGFLLNIVYDPDNFLDLLFDLHHRIGAANTTRRYVQHTCDLAATHRAT